MKREKILNILVEYEKVHPVENYTAFDWQVWPLLRVMVAFEALHQLVPRAPTDANKNLRKFLAKFPGYRQASKANLIHKRQKEIEMVLPLDRSMHEEPDTPAKQVVLLTLSGRRIERAGTLYEIYTDPLGEFLARNNITYLTWEHGEERWPRTYKSAWISKRLAFELIKAPQHKPLPEPDWFKDFVEIAKCLLGRIITWEEIEGNITRVQHRSQIFEKWLKRTGAQMLIAVCWYDPLVMAATLAARRLNILSVELQHGLQDSNHFAYSSWIKSPSSGYKLVPNLFWTWGKKQAERLMLGNPAFAHHCKTVIGGNFWFNQYRSGHNIELTNDRQKALELTKCFDKTVLVTLQKGFNFYRLVADAIRESPSKWLWLIRIHPGTSINERTMINELFNNIQPPGVNIKDACSLPLLPLLRKADVHVTGHSTCVLEALGLGVPSVLVTKEGANVYSEYIMRKVALYADTKEHLIYQIKQMERVETALCIYAAEDIFLHQGLAEKNVSELLSSAGIHAGG